MCFLFRHDLLSLLKMLRSNREAFSGRVVQGSNETVAAMVDNTATVDAITSTPGKILECPYSNRVTNQVFLMQDINTEADMSSTATTTGITALAKENKKKKAGLRGLYDRAPPTHSADSAKWKGKQHCSTKFFIHS